MTNVRIIPRLDIKGPNLVKGVHLEGLRVLGQPQEFARHYYETGADELVYMDVVASLYGRNSLHDIVQRTAREVFIPLTVGGGLRTLDDIRDVLRAGADKVSLNTAALKDPDIIRAASRRFGSSTIVITIEAVRQPDGNYLAYTDNGREHTGVEVLSWARRAEELGAGEILLTSVDREGTGGGFDMELTRMVADAVGIPVIASGGCGETRHVPQVVLEGHADAVSLASVLHYDHIAKRTSFTKTESEGNYDFLASGRTMTTIRAGGIPEIKREMAAAGIPCRNWTAPDHDA